MRNSKVAVRHLPRIDLAKLRSQDPAERRPTVDALGESLCRHGAVRVLLDGTSALADSTRIGLKVLGGLERYFGLPSGRLSGLVTADSKAVEVDEQACVVRIGPGEPPENGGPSRSFSVEAAKALGLEIDRGDPATSSVPWTPRIGEILVLAGPCLAAWTGGVVAVGSVTIPTGAAATKNRLSRATGASRATEALGLGVALWGRRGEDERLVEFLPG
jgi:hypothetical protein